MKVYVVCKSCNNKVVLDKTYSSRWDLYNDIQSKDIVLYCKKCHNKNNYNINRDTTAKKNIYIEYLIIPVFISMGIITYFLLPHIKNIISMFLLPVGISIPLLIYNTILKEVNKKVKLFNSSKIE